MPSENFNTTGIITIDERAAWKEENRSLMREVARMGGEIAGLQQDNKRVKEEMEKLKISS